MKLSFISYEIHFIFYEIVLISYETVLISYEIVLISYEIDLYSVYRSNMVRNPWSNMVKNKIDGHCAP